MKLCGNTLYRLRIGTNAHNALKLRRMAQTGYDDIFASMREAIDSHGFAMYGDNLTDFVLGFWNECESHFDAFKLGLKVYIFTICKN